MLPHNLLILAFNQGNIDEQLVNARKVTEMEGKDVRRSRLYEVQILSKYLTLGEHCSLMKTFSMLNIERKEHKNSQSSVYAYCYLI